MRRSSSSNITRISRRASDAPRQKWVPNPNATWWLCSRSTSNCSGSSNTASSRFAEPYIKRSSSPGLDRLAVQLVGLGRGPTHVEDRRDPPDELLDRGGADPGRVLDEQLRAGRAGAPARRQIAPITVRVGLGATVEHEERLVHDLAVVERSHRAVGELDLGVRPHRDEVVARLDPPGGERLLRRDGELEDRVHGAFGNLARRAVGGVLAALVHRDLGPLEALGPEVGLEAEQLADHARREGSGERAHDVALAAARSPRRSAR